MQHHYSYITYQLVGKELQVNSDFKRFTSLEGARDHGREELHNDDFWIGQFDERDRIVQLFNSDLSPHGNPEHLKAAREEIEP